METLGGTRADLIINTASGGFSSGFYGKHSSCLSIVCFKKKRKAFELLITEPLRPPQPDCCLGLNKNVFGRSSSCSCLCRTSCWRSRDLKVPARSRATRALRCRMKEGAARRGRLCLLQPRMRAAAAVGDWKITAVRCLFILPLLWSRDAFSLPPKWF